MKCGVGDPRHRRWNKCGVGDPRAGRACRALIGQFGDQSVAMRLQPRDDVGMLGRDVVGFGNVVGQVHQEQLVFQLSAAGTRDL